MPHLDEDDLRLILEAMEKKEQAHKLTEHAEDFNKDGTPKIHNRNIKGRVVMIVVVIGVMTATSHLIHFEVLVRVTEMGVVSFFDWWFNVAKEGKAAIPKVKVPKVKLPKLRKNKQPNE